MKKLEKNLALVERVFNEFNDLFDTTAKSIKRDGLLLSFTEIAAHIASLKDEHRLLKVGIIGRIKAGKSSLINALLFDGREVLPKAATPMTAALTTISYSEKFSAKVDFFSQKDIADLAEKKYRYDQELSALIKSKKQEMQERQVEAQNAGRTFASFDDEKLKQMAERELAASDLSMKAAVELYEKIQQSALDSSNLPAHQELALSSEQALSGELYEYVGSEGKYMPVTSCLHMGLPLEHLKDIEIVDTPGLNDAVASREDRTYRMLKECNVVFIVSPAGQLLNAHDLELANRLTEKDGIQEIYIVASQIDTQLHGLELRQYAGDLPSALNHQKNALVGSVTDTLASQQNKVLKNLAEKSGRLFFTSGLCHTLLAQPEPTWDATARHALGNLKKNFPTYFSPENQQSSLMLLAGREPLLNAITSVRAQKDSILAEQLNYFTSAQEQAVVKAAKLLAAHFNEQIKKINNTDIKTAEEKVAALKNSKSKGEMTAQNAFEDSIRKFHIDFGRAISSKIRDFKKKFDDSESDAYGSEEKEFKKDGWGSGFARLFRVGGYETRTVDNLNTAAVRNALEDFKSDIASELWRVMQEQVLDWNKLLISTLVGGLRGVIDDNLIDGDKLNSICRNLTRDLSKFPQPTISELPSNLAKSNKLTGYDMERYVESASEYIYTLMREADLYQHTMLSKISEFENYSMGCALFDSWEVDVSKLLEQVKTKKTSIDRHEKAIEQLSEISL